MAEKVRRYIHPVLVRFDDHTFLALKDQCREKVINEAVYCRKATELCLRRNLIKNGSGKET